MRTCVPLCGARASGIVVDRGRGACAPDRVNLHFCARLPHCRNLCPAAMLLVPRISGINREAIMTKSAAAAYFNVFTVREFEGSTGQKAKSWTKVGVAFPHREGPGFNLELSALPLDGRLVALAPTGDEEAQGE